MTRIRTCAVGLAIVLASVAAGAASPSDVEILEAADLARGKVEGIAWTVELMSYGKKGERSQTYDVLARGHDARIEATAPRKIKRQRILMLSGNMWFYKPGLSKPVPISRRQRLLGQASYGDIAATNYAGDYSATRLDDVELDGEPCYVFDLRSQEPGRTTYDRIKYWVSKERLVGVRAEYFTVSGKLFKSADVIYGHEIQHAGERRPFVSALTIHEELVAGPKTTMRFSVPELRAARDEQFDLNLLMH